MNLESITEKIQDLIFEGETKPALELLKKNMNRKSTRFSTFLLLGARYNSIADKQMSDTIESQEARIVSNKIGSDLLEFVGTLEEKDIGGEVLFSNLEISNKIVAYTTQDKKDKMDDFFKMLNFINVEVLEHSEKIENLEDYDLVIFDNSDLPVLYKASALEEKELDIQNKVRNRISKMESIINGSTKFIIHYGDILYWVGKNRNRVQAANSKFTLHARTKEVIEFINTYRF